MASAKLTKALASGNVKLRKAPRISGEVQLLFYPLMDKATGKTNQPQPITISSWKEIDPLKRSDVTLENLRHSNLADLVRKQAVILL